MSKGFAGVYILIGILILAAITGAFYFGKSQIKPSTITLPQTASPTPQPFKLTLRPKDAPAPSVITSLPPNPNANLFKNPNEPAYVPGKGFSPDAQRILEITSLRISLAQYKVANNRYPATLNDLFPNYAPVENGIKLAVPPVDPETRQPYSYTVDSSGSNYQLSATLSSGKQYTRTN